MSNGRVSIPPATPDINGLMVTVAALKLAVDNMSNGSASSVVTASDLSQAVASNTGASGGSKGNIGSQSAGGVLLDKAIKQLRSIFLVDVNNIKTELDNARQQAIAETQSALQDLRSAIQSNGTTIIQLQASAGGGGSSAAVTAEAAARASADSALAGSISSLTATVGGNTTAISNEAVSRAAADSSLSSTISTVSSVAGRQRIFVQSTAPAAPGPTDDAIWIDTANGNLFKTWNGSAWVASDDIRISGSMAAITTETTARTTADSALSASITSLTSTVNGNTTAISTEASTRASADTSLNSLITSLTSTVNGNTTAITNEATTRANADTALNASISSLTSTVSGNTAAISTESSTRASADSTLAGQITSAQAQLDTATASGDMQLIAVASPQSGVAAEFSVNVRATTGGSFAQSGLRLRAMSSGGSEVLIQAGKFIISSGTALDGSGTDFTPFSITVNGLESNAVLNGNLLVNGSITGTKIAAGTISASNIAASTITSTQIAAYTITGTNIAGSTITGTNIAANTIEGTNIDANTITTNHLIVNSVSGQTSTYWTSSAGSGWAQGNEVLYYYPDVGNVLIHYTGAVRAGVGTATFQLYIDGGLVQQRGSVAAGSVFSNFWTGYISPGVTHTIQIVVSATGSSTPLSDFGMYVLETKR